MDVDRAKSLRQSWKAKGNPPCTHPRVDPESNPSGYFTGHVVCKTCGAQIQTDPHQEPSATTTATKKGWGRYALFTSMGLLAAAVPVLTVWYKQRRRKFQWDDSDQYLP